MPRSTSGRSEARSEDEDPSASSGARSPKTAKPRKPRAAKATGKAGEIRLTGDRLIVRSPENGERKTAGGLLIPATAMPAPRRLSWGDVHQTGPDVRVAKEGDRVLYLPSSVLEVELDGEEFVLLRERDVQAVSSGPADGSKDHAPGQYL
jgi:chaperonin GroES